MATALERVVNDLLRTIGVSLQIETVQDCVPSLWLVLVEGLFQTRIPGTIRFQSTPLSDQDKLQNIQKVLDWTASTLDLDLSHISAWKMFECEPTHISFFLDILVEVQTLLKGSEALSPILASKSIDFSIKSPNHGTSPSGEASLQPSMATPVSPVLSTPHVYYPVVSQRKQTPKTVLKRAQTPIQNRTKPSLLKRHSVMSPLQKKKVKLEQQVKKTNQAIHQSIQQSTQKKRSYLHPQPMNDHDFVEEESSFPMHPTFTTKAETTVSQATEYPVERDFNRLGDYAQTHLPLLDEHPRVKDHQWNKQVTGWKRALDDRLWRRQRDLCNLVKNEPKQTLNQNEDLRRQRVKEEQEHQETLRKAKIALRERERRVVKMTAYQKSISSEISRHETKRKHMEERVLNDIYQDYLKKQRLDIIEKAFEAKQVEKRLKKAEAQRQEAKENYYKDQIRLLTEKLEEKKKEEKLIQKAHEEELRRVAREQKKIMKRGLEAFKQKLEQDDQSLYQEWTAEHLKESVFSNVRRRQ